MNSELQRIQERKAEKQKIILAERAKQSGKKRAVSAGKKHIQRKSATVASDSDTNEVPVNLKKPRVQEDTIGTSHPVSSNISKFPHPSSVQERLAKTSEHGTKILLPPDHSSEWNPAFEHMGSPIRRNHSVMDIAVASTIFEEARTDEDKKLFESKPFEEIREILPWFIEQGKNYVKSLFTKYENLQGEYAELKEQFQQVHHTLSTETETKLESLRVEHARILAEALQTHDTEMARLKEENKRVHELEAELDKMRSTIEAISDEAVNSFQEGFEKGLASAEAKDTTAEENIDHSLDKTPSLPEHNVSPIDDPQE